MTKIERIKAREQGLTRYFSGVPCLRGHVCERQVSSATCVQCIALKKKDHYEANKDRLLEYRAKRRIATLVESRSKGRDYYMRNKDRIREAQREYSAANSAKAVKRAVEWQRQHPDKKQARVAQYRARKSKAVPVWFGEFDRFVWEEAARLVRLRKRCTGVSWDADHIVPINGVTVTGLHVGTNCQVIPSIINRIKSNRMLFTNRNEWIGAL